MDDDVTDNHVSSVQLLCVSHIFIFSNMQLKPIFLLTAIKAQPLTFM